MLYLDSVVIYVETSFDHTASDATVTAVWQIPTKTTIESEENGRKPNLNGGTQLNMFIMFHMRFC